MKPFFRFVLLLPTVVSLFVLPSQQVASAEDIFEVKQGWTLALSGRWNQLSGALNGKTIGGTTGGSIVLSEVKEGISYGLAVGGRGPNGALSLGYSVSAFDNVVSSGDRSTKFEVLDLNAKVFLWSKQRFQPFFIMGLNFPRLTLKNAATLNAGRGNARLDGYGINAGGGAAYYFSPRLSLSLDVLYREMRFDTIEGLSGSGSFNASQTIRSISAGTSLSYTF